MKGFLYNSGKRAMRKGGRTAVLRILALALCVGILMPCFVQALPADERGICEDDVELFDEELPLPEYTDEGEIPADDADAVTSVVRDVAANAAALTLDNPVQFVPVPEGNVNPTHKFVSNWNYVYGGTPAIAVDKTVIGYKYSLELYLQEMPANAEKLREILPKQISCTGGNWGNALVAAGFEPAEGNSGTGTLQGYVNVLWDLSGISASMLRDGGSFTIYAQPISNPGYLIRVNTNDTSWKDTSADGVADTAESKAVLNLTVTLRQLDLADHIVESVEPADTQINLFDYWVDTDGAVGDDLLGKSDMHAGADGVQSPRTAPADWNQGINAGRLLLFGDGNIHAGFWNKGAGAGVGYGKYNVGMTGIVAPTLDKNGYPVINTTAMQNAHMEGYTESSPTVKVADAEKGISDWQLCGDHTDNSHSSANPKNISDTVQGFWRKSGNSASLDYLFDGNAGDYKRVHTNVKGLFQLDENGYYYYNMRRNFAEYDENENKFILYDAAAVDRTDGIYDTEGGKWTTRRSVGNFLPFNKGAQVFDGLDDNGKLSSSPAISSHNEKSSIKMNHHLGMTMTVDFRQPDGGKVNMGAEGMKPMTFLFSGDDDVWIFVDDVLVLDLGGIHSEIYGVIDFSTGEVCTGQSWKTNGFPHKNDGTVDIDKMKKDAMTKNTLKAMFTAAGKHTEDTDWSGNTFAGNTTHTVKMFYLERGNYDSSLAIRFNLQSRLYQQIKKVDQNGKPLEGVEFALYEATTATAGDEGAIRCANTLDGNVAYIKQSGDHSIATLTTGKDGVALFVSENEIRDAQGNLIGYEPFNFADRTGDFYILKETHGPDGYRPLPIDIVLQFDRANTMLVVANRWTTGAYASAISNITGSGKMSYGVIQDDGTVSRSDKIVDADMQENGLVIATPMLLQKKTNTWLALYGNNVEGFKTAQMKMTAGVADSQTQMAMRRSVLSAVLYQAASEGEHVPHWYLTWDDHTRRLEGVLPDLPGAANRFRLNNSNGDMQMVYSIITPTALETLGIDEKDAADRYAALGEYVRNKAAEFRASESSWSEEEALFEAVNTTVHEITGTEDSNTANGMGFSFLNVNQFNREFRSLIYIPNEQRELRVRKVDQDGRAVNGAVFALYDNANCSGTPVARGTTATVDGVGGTLIFKPQPEMSGSSVKQGYAQMVWARRSNTNYYLKEISAPSGYIVNPTVVPVVVGIYSIYADAGTPDDGVTVMAGVGKLAQTMTKYASDGEVNITLRDIVAYKQTQPSGEFDLHGWKDEYLSDTAAPNSVRRSMSLHYGLNAVVDYGLHDYDYGENINPFFVTDTGFVRAQVYQNWDALKDDKSALTGEDNNGNRDDISDTEITSLFSLLNVVVVTDRTTPDTKTGELTVSKKIVGSSTNYTESDYMENFIFTVELFDASGAPLSGEYRFYGTHKAGYVASGDEIPLHHDESITILGLPAGSSYKVTEKTEKQESGWNSKPASGVAEGKVADGENCRAAFVNSKEQFPPEGELMISKTVTGTAGDTTRSFNFTVTFIGSDGQPLSSELKFDYDGSLMGEIASGAVITLAHGQYVTIHGLLAGTSYTVVETEANADGYTTTAEGDSGTIAKAEIAKARFVNNKDKPRPSSGPVVPTSSSPSPSPSPSMSPSPSPSNDPSASPSPSESPSPSDDPSASPSPSGDPSASTTPSDDPTSSTTPSGEPETSTTPSEGPGTSTRPSHEPFVSPRPKTSQKPLPPELPDPNDPETPEYFTIWDEDTPTTYIKVWDPEEEEFYWIDEDETALAGFRIDREVPTTGDSSNMGLYLAVAVLSAAGIAGLSFRRKKEEK